MSIDCIRSSTDEILLAQEEEQKNSKFQIFFSNVLSNNYYRIAIILLLGQFLSLMITATGVCSQYLANDEVDIPTSQSCFNYVLLSLYCLVMFKRGEFISVLKQNWWKYLLIAFADVEANFLVVYAYEYTSLTSVMLLDSFTIPCVMFLSYFLLKARYSWLQFLGVVVCLAGLVLLAVSDATQNSYSESNPLLGDGLCLCGAVLYAISNVGQELSLKTFGDQFQYLGFIGLFGSLISAIQMVILERQKLAEITWTWPIVGYMLGFALSMFALYSLTPMMMKLSSATLYNLSILTSDFFSLVFSVYLFQHKPSVLYIVSFVLTVTGLIVYNVRNPGKCFANSQSETTPLQ